MMFVLWSFFFINLHDPVHRDVRRFQTMEECREASAALRERYDDIRGWAMCTEAGDE